MLRRALLRRSLPGSIWLRQPSYRLVEIDVCEVLVQLRARRAVSVELRPREGRSLGLHLVLHLLPPVQMGQAFHAGPERLFVAVLGMGHGIVPVAERLSIEQIQSTLRLSRGPAAIVTAFLSDLGQAQTGTTGPI